MVRRLTGCLTSPGAGGRLHHPRRMSYDQRRSGSIGAMGGVAITDGWNWTVRLDRPRSEILDDTWTFPAIASGR